MGELSFLLLTNFKEDKGMSIMSWIKSRFTKEARIRRLKIVDGICETLEPILLLIGKPEAAAIAKGIEKTAETIEKKIEDKPNE